MTLTKTYAESPHHQWPTFMLIATNKNKNKKKARDPESQRRDCTLYQLCSRLPYNYFGYHVRLMCSCATYLHNYIHTYIHTLTKENLCRPLSGLVGIRHFTASMQNGRQCFFIHLKSCQKGDPKCCSQLYCQRSGGKMSHDEHEWVFLEKYNISFYFKIYTKYIFFFVWNLFNFWVNYFWVILSLE